MASRKRKLLSAAVLLAVVAMLGQLFLGLAPARGFHPDVNAQSRVEELAFVLGSLREPAARVAAIRAFADYNRPESGSQEFLDPNTNLLVVVAAHGTWGHRDGWDAELAGGDPTLQLILVAGNGKSVGWLGTGGRGGVCRVAGKIVGLGGDGGAGIVGGDAGHGGALGARPGALLPADASGGVGGAGLVPGASGNGGQGIVPGGACGLNGHGGAGVLGGAGGGG